jgi:cyanophycinase
LRNKHSTNGIHKELTQLLGQWRTPGYLMIIGGADRLDPEARISKIFLWLVQRAEANSGLRDIVLVSTATRHPEILTGEYYRIFTKLGIPREKIHAPMIRNRDEAHRQENAELLAGAAGIFLTGGDQYTLTQMLDRTPAEDAIMQAFGNGAVVAGTSAGATAMGRPMIVAGGGSGELKMGVVQMSTGLAWAGDDLIIDTHFGARGRFPRLASAIAEHPAALGVGIDENTCLLVDAEGNSLVGGTGVVYFLDATQTHYNTAHGAHSGHPISVGPLNVNVLAAGERYNLRTRTVEFAARDAHKV